MLTVCMVNLFSSFYCQFICILIFDVYLLQAVNNTIEPSFKKQEILHRNVNLWPLLRSIISEVWYPLNNLIKKLNMLLRYNIKRSSEQFFSLSVKLCYLSLVATQCTGLRLTHCFLLCLPFYLHALCWPLW